MQTIDAKICILGDSGVGKSSLVTRFVHNTFSGHNESTIGASFMTKTIIHNNIGFKLNIWDTAGQEMYRALAPMYYRHAMVCIVVYDVTEENSFLSIHSWIRELKTHLKDKTIVAIAGNKCDLKDKKIDSKEVKIFTDSIDAIFMETSAKSAQNVNQLFASIVQKLPKETKPTEIVVTDRRTPEVRKCC